MVNLGFSGFFLLSTHFIGRLSRSFYADNPNTEFDVIIISYSTFNSNSNFLVLQNLYRTLSVLWLTTRHHILLRENWRHTFILKQHNKPLILPWVSKQIHSQAKIVIFVAEVWIVKVLLFHLMFYKVHSKSPWSFNFWFYFEFHVDFELMSVDRFVQDICSTSIGHFGVELHMVVLLDCVAHSCVRNGKFVSRVVKGIVIIKLLRWRRFWSIGRRCDTCKNRKKCWHY